MRPSRGSAREFVENYIDEEPDADYADESLGSLDDKPSKFRSAEDYLNEGPPSTPVEDVKDDLLELSRVKNSVSTPYA